MNNQARQREFVKNLLYYVRHLSEIPANKCPWCQGGIFAKDGVHCVQCIVPEAARVIEANKRLLEDEDKKVRTRGRR